MADITDAEIEHVATAMSAAGPGQTGCVLSGLARAALTAAAEIGWGKKPTRSELNDLLLSQYDQTAIPFSHPAVSRSIQQLLDAGFAVEDSNTDWEPTEEAVKDLADITIGTTDAATILKHIRAKPHLIGMGEDE